jgi:hypothetical protein
MPLGLKSLTSRRNQEHACAYSNRRRHSEQRVPVLRVDTAFVSFRSLLDVTWCLLAMRYI